MSEFITPRPLQAGDTLDEFDCGVEELNRYLQKHAYQTQAGDGARTYVSFWRGEPLQVAGYYTLAYGSIDYGNASGRLSKGLAKHPIPVMLLARLAVDKRFAGKRLGTGLLRDAMQRTLAAAEIAGLRAVVVDAKDDDAKRFYEKFRFEPLPDNSMRLTLILKDVRAVLRD